MKKHILIICLLLVAATSTSAQDRSTLTTDEARKIIANGYLDWGRARLALDRETFERMLAPGFTIQQPGRKLARQEFIDGISVARPNEKLTRYDITVLTVQTTSDSWVAIAQEKVEIESPGGNKGFSLKIIRAGWKQIDNRWMITYAETIGHENWTGGAKPPFQDWESTPVFENPSK
ncbi:MAG: hypothetical protein A2Y69_12460 [Candidatus Aminicenantes bacterium RBG_13_59_9]|nr:MAG: hypothetical protein A2Y69_12460 [Candidatus Aminicenantes bacterium RBG_13_59_9]